MKKNIKGMGAVVATALLLVVTVVAVLGFQNFFHTYQSGMFVDVEEKSDTTNSGIENLIGNDLYFRNGDSQNVTVEKILINGDECSTSSDLTVDPNKISKIDVSECINSINKEKTEISLITEKGVYSKYIYYKGGGKSSSSTVGNTTVEFKSGNTCSAGFLNVYDYYSSSLSHAAMPDQTDTNNALCIKDESFTINTDCLATSAQRLFYLGNVTNSHIWFDNSTAYEPYEGYYNWQEVCVGSTDGTVNVQYSSTDMTGSGYVQIGSYYTENATYGYTLGAKDVYTDKIWVKIS